MEQSRSPQNIGISAIELYFPKTYVSQSDLEKFGNIPEGKYTKGLGQNNMAFVTDCEDVNSMAMTVVQALLEKNNVDPRQIGRLEIGTETMLDKSKSSKTVLMQMFAQYGNHDIEGVTSVNACYGATNALFNTVSWMQSDAWDGRLGIVVASDVAVYAKGPARPTGGAGAVALLITPDATLVLEKVRASFFDHAYDFYKPNLSSEYPTVDGQLSIKSFLKALTECYKGMKSKLEVQNKETFSLDSVDYACFHTPYCKQTYKSMNHLFKIDMEQKLLSGEGFPYKIQEALSQHLDQPLNPKEQEQLFKAYWESKTKQSTFLSSQIGNIYTGSLYMCLASLLYQENIKFEKERILLFSYGSGLASSMFTLKVNKSTQDIKNNLNINEKLGQRVQVSAEKFDQIMQQREQQFNKVPLKPSINPELMYNGTFYVSNVDEKYRRTYEKMRGNPLIKNATKAVSQVSSEKREDSFVSLDSAPNVAGSGNNFAHSTSRMGMIKNQFTQNSVATTKANPIWTGFHKKTFKERIDHLKKLDPGLFTEPFETGGLNTSIADHMVENCIGKLSVPMGLGLNFIINGKERIIPMALEEPSVIAASSSAAKFIAKYGGFKSLSSDPIMRGQIQIINCNVEEATFTIDHKKKEIIEYANEACQNMVKRGGGVIDVKAKVLKADPSLKALDSNSSEMLIVDLFVNVCESMGANIINTIAEHTAPFIEDLVGGRAGIKILSNLATERKAMASFEIPVDDMGWKNTPGKEVAQKIMEGFVFAKNDIYRATTHNKGIMNGIDAAAIACGQDWRAIEAAAHAYTILKHGKYQPMTNYQIVAKPNGKLYFKGTLELPITVGTVGGVIQNNPIYKNSMRMMGYPTAQELGETLLCVGLANNFAALRAMAVEGIQKGHMNLHAKNIAISAGVPHNLAMDAVEFMKRRGKISKDMAKNYLTALDLYTELRSDDSKSDVLPQKLSTFFLDIGMQNLDSPIVINIALESCSQKPIHISIEEDANAKISPEDLVIKKALFGDKGYQWLQGFFVELDLIKFSTSKDKFDDDLDELTISKEPSQKLKLLSILINLLSANLVRLDYKRAKEIIPEFKKGIDVMPKIKEILKNESDTIRFGFSLLNELIKVFEYNLDVNLPVQRFRSILQSELFKIMESHILTIEMWQEAKKQNHFDLRRFLDHRRKRLCASMMLWCDALIHKPSELNQEILEKLKLLGEVYEIECTMARDISKWSGSGVESNLYTYWLLMKGKFLKGENLDTRLEFSNEILQISKEKKDVIFTGLGSYLLNQYEVTRFVIRNHYGIPKSILPPMDGAEPSL